MSTHITDDYKAFLITGEYTYGQLQELLYKIKQKQSSDKQSRYFKAIDSVPEGCIEEKCHNCYKTIGYVLPNGEIEYFDEDFCSCNFR